MEAQRLAPSPAQLGSSVVVTTFMAMALTFTSGLFLANYIAEHITWAEPVPSFPARTVQCFPLAVVVTAFLFTLLSTLLFIIRNRSAGYVSALVIGFIVGGSVWFSVLVSRPDAFRLSVVAFLVPCAAAALAVPLGRLVPAKAAT